MALLNWAILTIAYEVTATGIKITVTTNHPCHLFMRWTTQEPIRHIYPVIERGAPVDKDVRFCFTVFEDNEQEEAGDTTTHTFIKEPWAVCETRWFYFWGTVGGQSSPSETPILKKHRVYVPPEPVTAYFYPDPDPGVNSFDAWLRSYCTAVYLSWPLLHAGQNLQAVSNANQDLIWIRSSVLRNLWHSIYRGEMVFPTYTIPAGSTIQEAELRIRMSLLRDVPGWPNLGAVVVSADPASLTEATPADWHGIGNTPLSNIIPWMDIDLDSFKTFIFNPAGLAQVTPAGPTKLGLIESGYDLPNSPPPWARNQYCTNQYWTADNVTGRPFPRLKVIYIPP